MASDLLIQEHSLHPNNPYLFPSPTTGTMYSPETVARIHKRILRDAGLEDCRFHDLRHTFATVALQNGVDIKTLSGMLGHYSSGFTLDTYTHVTRKMQEEAAEGNDSLLSRVMCDKLTEVLAKKEQAILLLNRRGYTTYITCMDCRQPVACPNCNIPLTYHKKNDRYMCHYCGYTMDNIEHCPQCGSQRLKSSGVGTQRVEDELERLFPQARLLRMDADTTSSRYSYEENFKAFEKGEYDIMLGTQMIAKGLNFPNVTMVGVISLDKALFTGDFRSYERTFSLLTQVAGRSGRGDKPGVAYIQTFVPDHYVLNLAAEQNYDEFYKEEIALRKSLTYPPFCDICVIGFSAPLESKVIGASRWVTQLIKEYISQHRVNFPLRALGPAPCTFEMINNRYRYRLILKTRNTADFREMIKHVLGEFYKNKDYQTVRIYADINGDIGL